MGASDCPAGPPLLSPQAVSLCCTGCSAWPSLPLCRSVIVENSASSTNATEILKPVKKRKRKDYQSPSEEEYESEQMVGQRQGGVCAASIPGLGASPVCTDLIVLLRALSAAGQTGNGLAKMPKRLECVEMRAPSSATWNIKAWAVPDCPDWAVELSTLSCSLESGPPK